MEPKPSPSRFADGSPPRRAARAAMPALPAAIALLAALLAASPGRAATCTVDPVPAATLLLPYFEVDLADPNGLTTLFSVDNATPFALVAHAVVWSDWAVPVFNFDIYLTGYDVQTLNLRDLLVAGSLPRTADAGRDPLDTVSPKGAYSQDIPFASCDGKLPPPPMSPDQLAFVQAALTGRPSPLAPGLCYGRNLGDRVARGYVTIDTVSGCTSRVPGDPGYFAGGGVAGDVTDQNALWGNWYIVNSTHNLAQGGAMVAIEADAADPATSTAGRYTFYGRYVGWSGADHREPLATSFAAQYATGSTFAGATDLIVWRDPKVAQAPVDCTVQGAKPSWYPLAQQGIATFDEEEHPVVPPTFPVLQPPLPVPTPFPAATGRARVGDADLAVPYSFGWLYLDLNSSLPGVAGPASDPAALQAWVMAVESADGRYATGTEAFRLDSACAASHFFPQ
jgi:hypothetical protein